MNFSMQADIASIPVDPADGRSERNLCTSLDKISISSKALVVVALTPTVRQEILLWHLQGVVAAQVM